MINQKSDHFVLMIATYNRLSLLKKTVEAIKKHTTIPYEIIVIDGGSDDGTIEYIQQEPVITPFLQGKLVGSSRAYNEAWRQVECQYTCWLSDDTEITGDVFAKAVQILEQDSEIGMVGLKMKDTMGPHEHEAYMGGVSQYGILNCNHGVLTMSLLRKVGFFNESYRSYTIDPDLTASILCAGKKVVMTKEIAVLHHREWAVTEGWQRMEEEMGGIDNQKIYCEKFQFLGHYSRLQRVRRKFFRGIKKVFRLIGGKKASFFGINLRDWHNLGGARYVSVFDYIQHRNKNYYLEQCLPKQILRRESNPYGKFIHESQNEMKEVALCEN